MKHFTLDPEIIRLQKRKTIILVISLAVLINGIALIYFLSTGSRDQLLMRYSSVIIISIVISVAFISAISRIARINSSYKLSIGDGVVIREIGRFPAVEFTFGEITAIHKLTNGSFHIKGPNPQIYIVVPAAILHKSELEAELTHIQPLSNDTAAPKKFLPVFAALLGMVLMIVFYTTTNKWIFVPAGVVLVALLIFSSIITLRSPLLIKVFKLRVILYVFLMISISLTLYMKLQLS